MLAGDCSLESEWQQVQRFQLWLPSDSTIYLALRSEYLFSLLLSFILTLWLTGKVKLAHCLFLAIRSVLLVGTGWSVLILKFLTIFWVLFSRRDSGLCIYHLSMCGQSLVSCTVPSGSPLPPSHACTCTSSMPVCCIDLFSGLLFCLPFSLHSLHLLFSWVLSILAFILLLLLL